MTVSGTASVTDPIRNTVTPVHGHRLCPSRVIGSTLPAKLEYAYTTHSKAMTADEMQHDLRRRSGRAGALRGARVVGSGLTVRRPSTFALRVCGRFGPPARSRDRDGLAARRRASAAPRPG